MNELLLIELVKSHEELYNTQCDDYGNPSSRMAAWTEIAKQCFGTPEECRKTWTNLRNCLTNAKKRRLRKSGQKFSRWRYEEEMSFLDPFLKETPSWDTWDNNYEPSTLNEIIQKRERLDLLIDLIRRYEVIYNANCSEYGNCKERQAAWLEIADLHGSPVSQCKEIWLRLRNCYTNVLRRRRNKSSKSPITPWRYEKQMSFLKPFITQRNNSVEDSEVLLYDDDSSNEQSRDSERTRCATYKRKAISDNFINSADFKNTSELIYNNQDLDDVDHFFLSMSKMVKKLPKMDQLRIKLNLHEAISEAELRQLGAGECSRTIESRVVVKLENLSPGTHRDEELEYLE